MDHCVPRMLLGFRQWSTDEPEALPALMVWSFSTLPVVHSSETLNSTACGCFLYKLPRPWKIDFVENKITMIGGRTLLHRRGGVASDLSLPNNVLTALVKSILSSPACTGTPTWQK